MPHHALTKGLPGGRVRAVLAFWAAATAAVAGPQLERWPQAPPTSAAAELPGRPTLPGAALGDPLPTGLTDGCEATACLLGTYAFHETIAGVLEDHGLTVEHLDADRLAAGDLALCDTLYVVRNAATLAAAESGRILDWVAAGGTMLTEFDSTKALFDEPWNLFSGSFPGGWHVPSGNVCGGNTVRIVDGCTGLGEGLPEEWDCSGDPIGVLLVPTGLDPDELRIVARIAGSDADGDGLDDPLAATARLGDGGFVLFFSDFADFQALGDPRIGCSSCQRTPEDDALLVNAACMRFDGTGVGRRIRLSGCAGEELVLDISEQEIAGCDSTLNRWWVDDPAAPLVRTVVVTEDSVHEAIVDCAELECSVLVRYEITLVEPPPAPEPEAWSVVDCASGVHLEWEPVIFPAPEGGVYNVFRSELSCDDAVLSAPLVTGLTETTWFDDGAVEGVDYHYVVEAESHGGPAACQPAGAHASGPAARGCAGPVANVGEGEWPAGVFATLRLSHDGDEVTLDWSAARPLLPGEHFHVKKAVGTPPSDFDLVSPEPLADRQWSETDLTPGPHFFDLRVANPCETESEDEYPPSR